MSIETIFTAKKEHLHHLNSTDAVDLFREMVRTEALKFPPGTCKINVPRQDNVADGGIDATVDIDSQVIQSDIIASGQNSYQIKSGKRFKPWQKSEIKEELFGDRRPLNKENLGKKIRDCLDVEGTYILVCTGINLSKSQTEQTRSYIEKYLKEQCKYENPKVKVWSQDDLINFLDEFTLLVLGLRGLLEAKFKPHWSWSKVDSLQVPFIAGQEQKKLVARIQSELRRKDRAVYIPVWGDPGVGKTKLVLEATRADDLSPLVMYYRSISEFESSVLMNAISLNDNLSAIIVIDGCEPHTQIRIWDELKHQGDRIKLITISNNYDKIPEDVLDCKVLPLEDEQINEIIQHYKVPKFQADRHTDLCSGSPFMANHVGKVLAHSSGDASEVLSQDTIYKSFYVDLERENLNSPEVHQKELVLQHIALFKQFGYKGSVVTDAKAIAKQVKRASPQITWPRFRKIVKDLKKSGLLKGEYTLNITPKALHIKLWVDWWETYSDEEFNLEGFTQELTSKLVEWFYEMFKYAAGSEAASRIVEKLLGSNGPFQKGNYLQTNLGSHFFSTLTEANPKSALRCLMKTIGTWDRETLLKFTKGRRNVIWALEKIAMWEDLFTDAARLLLALGEAENESCSNNASGIFAELFSPAPGKVAPTEASPAKRFPVLKEAFESDSKERRILALRACDAALQSGHFSRSGSAEYQGLRPEPKLWLPKTYGELWDAYKRVWQFLSEQLEHLTEDERKEGVTILLEHTSGIGKIPDLGDMVVETVRGIAQNRYVNEKQVIEVISRILYYNESYKNNGLPTETRQQLEQLRDELVGSGFHSMMQRYVGMDLIEDKSLDDQEPTAQVKSQLETLSQQAVDNHHLLQSELHWLVTTEAQNGYRFGNELGKRDDSRDLLPMLLDAQRSAVENASVYFLSGYFRAIFDRDQPLWEEQLDALVGDNILNVAIPELTHRSGLTDRAGTRILELATSNIIDSNHFAIFAYGKTIKSLSNEIFMEWIKFLLNASGKFSVSVALHLYHRYYVFQKSEPALPQDLTFQLLAHPSLFEESEEYQFNQMTDYYWAEIAKVFIDLDREKSLELVVLMLSSFGQDGSIIDVDSQTCLVLDKITERYPAEVWQQVSKLLETQTHFSRMGSLERWLRKGNSLAREKRKGALTLIPPEKIWEWVDEDIENRAWHLTTFVPKTPSVEEWKTSLMREILVRYGTHNDVRNSLMEIYSGDGWSGPGSLYFKEKQQQLLRLKEGEDNENVKRWIDEFVDGLEEAIKDEKTDEERRF